MGRKGEFHLKVKRGPGRKTKKQQAPAFQFLEEEKQDRPLGRRQRVRAKKRELKQASKQEAREAKRRKKESDDVGSDGEELESRGSDMDDDEGGADPAHSDEDSDEDGEPAFTEDDETDDDDEAGNKPGLFDDDDDDSDAGAAKPALFDSDVSEDDDDDDDDDSDSDEGDIEKKSRKLEKQRLEDEAMEEAYMAETAGKVTLQIPTLEEVEEELRERPDMSTIQARIKDTAFVLTDFSTRREEGRSRKEYLSIFLKDLCAYYSYNEFLMEKLMDMFGPTELVEFLEVNEKPRPVTIRTNTLKTRRKVLATSLIDAGVDVDIIGWSKVGLIVMQSGGVTLGATPQYLAGHYLIQGASSFLPVMALGVKGHEKVLDMCAAPGGKSTHIAAAMRNTGYLVSNDVHVDRVKALVGNFHRMGITNTVITAMDARLFAKKMPRMFDRVLLDAPCSGTGVISKDTRVKTSKDIKDLQRCSHLQRELLLAAIDSVHKSNGDSGVVVYSTCSIMIEENEEVVDYALRKRHVELVATGLEVGKEGFVHYRGRSFDPSMNLCKRVYPHIYNMDGFFVAKLRKLADGVKGDDSKKQKGAQQPKQEQKSPAKQNGDAEGQGSGKGPGKKGKGQAKFQGKKGKIVNGKTTSPGKKQKTQGASPKKNNSTDTNGQQETIKAKGKPKFVAKKVKGNMAGKKGQGRVEGKKGKKQGGNTAGTPKGKSPAKINRKTPTPKKAKNK